MDNISILLAEDNQDDEFLTLRALRKAGFKRVTVVKDGQETLLRLFGGGSGTEVPVMPDLLITDLRMPRIGGINVVRRLRSDDRTSLLPVIVLTSSEDPQDRVVCRELGVLAILSKPLTADLLRRVISSIPRGDILRDEDQFPCHATQSPAALSPQQES